MTLADYLAPAFLETLLRTTQPGPVQVLAATPFPLDNSASILAVLTAGHTGRPLGHYGLRVHYTTATGEHTENLVLKLKPPGAEVSAMLGSLAQACGEPLAAVYPAFELETGFAHTHQREQAVYAHLADPSLMPAIRGWHASETQGVYALLMEYLAPPAVALLNTVHAPQRWTDAHLRAALTQLAGWHAEHLRPAGATLLWPDAPTAANMQQRRPLWQGLLDNAALHHPALLPPARVARLQAALNALPTYWAELEAQPRTLVHNDLNPRNSCFRPTPAGPRLCAYDWELATYHVPPYDAVELLSFVLTPDRYAQRLPYLELYRRELHARTGQFANAAAFRRLAALAALDFGLHRLGMYLMAHAVSPYPFLPRVVDSYFDTLDQLRAELPELVAAGVAVAAGPVAV